MHDQNVYAGTNEDRAYARLMINNARQAAYAYIGYLGGASDERVAQECLRFGGKAAQYASIIRSFGGCD